MVCCGDRPATMEKKGKVIIIKKYKRLKSKRPLKRLRRKEGRIRET